MTTWVAITFLGELAFFAHYVTFVCLCKMRNWDLCKKLRSHWNKIPRVYDFVKMDPTTMYNYNALIKNILRSLKVCEDTQGMH